MKEITEEQKKIAQLQREKYQAEETLSKLEFAYRPFLKHSVSDFKKKLSTPNIVLEDMDPDETKRRYWNHLMRVNDPALLYGVIMVAGSCPSNIDIVSWLKETLEQEIARNKKIISDLDNQIKLIKSQKKPEQLQYSRQSGNPESFFKQAPNDSSATKEISKKQVSLNNSSATKAIEQLKLEQTQNDSSASEAKDQSELEYTPSTSR